MDNATIAIIFIIGVGLSMDAMAISICKGLVTRKEEKLKTAIACAVYFGFFQALMPLLGYLLGNQFESTISSFDHWLAFILLSFIGGKMIYEALKGGEEDSSSCISFSKMLPLAVATSIDALAVGISLVALDVEIIPSCLMIGITTAVISFLGCFFGSLFGAKLKDKAGVLGGVILIVIGFKILFEHLGIIS